MVAEGAVDVASGRWRPDAAGVMTPAHGVGQVAPLAWPQHGPPRFARHRSEGADTRWLSLIDREGSLSLWSGGDSTRLGPWPALAGGDVFCDRGRCGVLTGALDDVGAPLGRGTGATLSAGDASAEPASWPRTLIALSRGEPLAIVSLAPDEVALVDDLRVRFMRLPEDAAPAVVAALPAPHGALAASGSPRASMGRAAPRCSDEDSGGVMLSIDGATSLRLRSATQASRGSLHPLRDGVLALWMAPERCDAPRHRLHAVVVRNDGMPVAPVITVGRVDDYAAASSGEDVDIWLQHNKTVSWIRASCSAR